ncbi:hypothetical protein DSO57_1022266 [Entomophthora muscae]|uniref:Uncharacterized protein n=1 Tax=Entomophthora muscae TaxID=34485 RepID=A0ACC2RHV6_9FUNG|nr:hypothetical protein DSO57_1022266 [Entomophthora muscae]
MLVPLIKFVIFGGCISHSFHHVGANPDQFVHLLENIPGCAQDIFAASENVARSLTCDDLKFSVLDSVPPMTPSPAIFPSPPSGIPVSQVSEEDLIGQELALKCALWLLGGMLLMGLDSYFPRLSTTSSLWTCQGSKYWEVFLQLNEEELPS